MVGKVSWNSDEVTEPGTIVFPALKLVIISDSVFSKMASEVDYAENEGFGISCLLSSLQDISDDRAKCILKALHELWVWKEKNDFWQNLFYNHRRYIRYLHCTANTVGRDDSFSKAPLSTALKWLSWKCG